MHNARSPAQQRVGLIALSSQRSWGRAAAANRLRWLSWAGVALLAVGGLLPSAAVAGPPNPYSSFNLSGINYGAQQWERDQRAGKRVWPYYNTPSQTPTRRSAAVSGYAGRGVRVQGGVSRRSNRRWQR
jgi:hypothetical protein